MKIKRLLLVLNILLLAGVAVLLVRPLSDVEQELDDGFGSETFRYEEHTSVQEHQEDLEVAMAQAGEDDYNLLTESDPFGVLEAEQERERRQQAERRADPEPAGPLELDLLGTVAGDSSLARAIIQLEGDGRQGIYKVGESVADAEIVQISRKKVLLSRDGTYYELTMDMTQAVEIEGEEGVLSMDDFEDAISLGSDFIEVDRQELLDQGGGMFAMMRQVQENLQVEVYMEEGSPAGLRLQGVDDIGLAKLAGIEEGDVVKSVNGQAISSVPRALREFRRVRHLDEVNVELLRDGEQIEKSYRIN